MNNNTPTTNRRPITFLILAVLLAIGLALGLYLYSKGNLNSSKSASQPYKYTYSKLDSFTLLGQGPGDGISFQKPVQIATGDVQGHLHIRLNHSTMMQVLPSNKGSQPVLVAKLMVESDTTTTPPNADYLKFIKEDIKKPGSATAKGFKEQLSNFIAKDLTNYTVSLNSLQPITGGNLAGNAWAAEYTAKPKISSQTSTLPDQKGKAIIAIGKSTYYFFAADTVDYNWAPNQAVWDKVFNSLKIDQ